MMIIKAVLREVTYTAIGIIVVTCAIVATSSLFL